MDPTAEQAVVSRIITIIFTSDFIIYRCMLIAIGSSESAASLVVIRIGLVELLLGDQMLICLTSSICCNNDHGFRRCRSFLFAKVML